MSGRKSIHPLTEESIRAQGVLPEASPSFSDWACGCERRRHPDGWWLCGYHEGYEDAMQDQRGAGDGA